MRMNRKIEKIKNFRLFLLKQIEGMTHQQLNDIPAGYHNNIIWNLAHLICVEQNMCYVRANLPIVVDSKYFSPYMPGTKPERFIDAQETKSIKELFITSIDKLQSDVDKNIFTNYSPSVMIPKVYGFDVRDIDEAFDYLLYHEGFHTGYILSLKHLILKSYLCSWK
jgi:hypothetical protein